VELVDETQDVVDVLDPVDGVRSVPEPCAQVRILAGARLRWSELVDVDGEQDDGSIRNELADNDCRGHEPSSRDEVPVVLAVGIQGRELIEALGEGIGDRGEVQQQEVACGGFAVRSAALAQLRVEFSEEL